MRYWLLTLLLICGITNANNSPDFVVCYDFGCKSTQDIKLNAAQWSAIDAIFARPALSAWLEKQQIRQAIAMMENISGKMVGTDQDKAGNYPGYDVPKQQDCIDESTNTMQYLSALQNRGTLHWHELVGKERRIVWFYTHWTAVIREKNTDELFAVDSWYRDNGQPPYIQKLDDWRRKDTFPQSLNP